MIDGIKILNLPVRIPELLGSDLLNFTLRTDDRTGEILSYYTNYKGLEFIIKNNNARLQGSIHKYKNSGLHNFDDFSFTDIVRIVIQLCKTFNFNPRQTLFNNVEFGVNIIVPFDINDLFKSIISYKGTPFQRFNIPGASGIECKKDDFIIKIYNKGLQYNQRENTLRIEIKVISMKFFKDRKIKLHSLSDLMNIDIYPQLQTILRGGIDEILFYDNTIDLTKINPADSLILSNGRNPKYWEDIKSISKDYTGGNQNSEYKRKRKKYYRELSKYASLMKQYSTSAIKKNTCLLIDEKFKELIICDDHTRDKLTDFLKQYSEEIDDNKNSEKGQIIISHIEGICPPLPDKDRKCLTCGIDISQKKKTARYCSKKCKNKHTNPILNPKNNLKKRIKKNKKYPALFDTDSYLMLSVAQKQILDRPNSIYE